MATGSAAARYGLESRSGAPHWPLCEPWTIGNPRWRTRRRHGGTQLTERRQGHARRELGRRGGNDHRTPQQRPASPRSTFCKHARVHRRASSARPLRLALCVSGGPSYPAYPARVVEPPWKRVVSNSADATTNLLASRWNGSWAGVSDPSGLIRTSPKSCAPGHAEGRRRAGVGCGHRLGEGNLVVCGQRPFAAHVRLWGCRAASRMPRDTPRLACLRRGMGPTGRSSHTAGQQDRKK